MVGREKTERWCEKCDYCEDGTVFRRCLKCGKCFCEWHAGAWGYCYRCAEETVKSGEEKTKDSALAFLKDSAEWSVLKFPETPEHRDRCTELRLRMELIKRKHERLNDELLECQRKLQQCLTNHSDEEIEQGACVHWVRAMNDIRAEQRKLYEEFLRLRKEFERECGGG